VEIKHARVAMLAAVGFLVGENVHPLWGGGIDVPSYVAFQATPLQTFWKWTVAVLGLLEIASVMSFELPIRGGWTDRAHITVPALSTPPVRSSHYGVLHCVWYRWKDGVEYTEYPMWSIKPGHTPGDFGFDPAGLLPSSPAELKSMQTKELNKYALGLT
jgi:light-harvesting complex I chlorophyll a/b binding protein 4